MKHIVIGHNDLDGRCAAAIVVKFLGNDDEVKLVESSYGDGLNVDELNKSTTLWIVDFSFPDFLMIEADKLCHKVYWIDHHLSAAHLLQEKFENTTVLFDDKHAACQIAFRSLFPHKKIPSGILLAEDRDIWEFKYGDITRNFCEAADLYLTQPEGEYWGNLFSDNNDVQQGVIDEFVKVGEVLREAKAKRIQDAYKRGYYGYINGQAAYYVNASVDISEIGEKIYLSHEDPIVGVIYYHDGAGKTKFSLRSTTVDVREIAEKHKGGGHMFAAGFTINTTDMNKIREALGDSVNLR